MSERHTAAPNITLDELVRRGILPEQTPIRPKPLSIKINQSLSIRQWMKMANQLADITPIRTVDDLPILVEAIKQIQGDDPAPQSILWLWITARISKFAKGQGGLWVWQRPNPTTGKKEYLVCSISPNHNQIDIYAALTNPRMAADFINYMPPVNDEYNAHRYNIARAPEYDTLGINLFDWEKAIQSYNSVTEIRQYERDYYADYFFGPFLCPTNKLAGTVTQNNKGAAQVRFSKSVPPTDNNDFLFAGIETNENPYVKERQSLKKELETYQNEVNHSLGKIVAEPLDPHNKKHREAFWNITREWMDIKNKNKLPKKRVRQLSQTITIDYYKETLSAFAILQGHTKHPKYGERFRGYLFRRASDNKPIGFEIFELPLNDHAAHPCAYGVSALSLTDKEHGVPGATSFMLHYVGSKLKDLGIEYYSQGGVENKELWASRKKTLGFEGTLSVNLCAMRTFRATDKLLDRLSGQNFQK